MNQRRGLVVCFVGVALWGGLSPFVARAAAQDPFETEVYGYETAEPGEWELEGNLIYMANGTTAYDGPVAPSDHQAHLALEVTHGLTRHWEAGAYLLTAYRPGAGVEYAGWRLRTRVRLPESWGLPMNTSLAAELEFAEPAYDENASALELRATLGRRFGRVQLDLNPVVERALRLQQGMGEAEGWEFEPSARLGVTVSRSVAAAVEYYGNTGVLGGSVPLSEQVHQFFPSVDVKLGDDFTFDIGVGFGTTPAGNQLVFKSRWEIPLRE